MKYGDVNQRNEKGEIGSLICPTLLRKQVFRVDPKSVFVLSGMIFLTSVSNRKTFRSTRTKDIQIM